MPTNRRRVDRQPVQRITPEVAEAWRIGDRRTVDRALIKPWEVSPFDAVGEPPAWGQDTPWIASWPKAVELRAALVEAAGSPGRVGRHGEPLGPVRDGRGKGCRATIIAARHIGRW